MARISTIGAYDNSDLEAQILKLEEKIEGIPDDIAATFQEIEAAIDADGTAIAANTTSIAALAKKDVTGVSTAFDADTRILTTEIATGAATFKATAAIPGGGSGGSYTAGSGIEISDANAISAAVDGSSVVLSDGKIAAAPVGVTAPLKKDTALDISLLYDAGTLALNANGELAVKDPAVAYTGGDGISVTGTTVAAVYDDTTIKVNSNGQLYAVGGGSGGDYTAGQGISIADQEIKASIDGSTITFNDAGQMVAAAGTEYTGGDGISVTDGTIAAQVDGTRIVIDDGKITAGAVYTSGIGTIVDNQFTHTINLAVDDSTIKYDPNNENRIYVKLDKGLIEASGVKVNVDGDTIKFNSSGQIVAQYPTYSAGSAISIDSSNQIGVMTDGTTIKLNDSGQLYATGGTEYTGGQGIAISDGQIWVKIDDMSIKPDSSGYLYVNHGNGLTDDLSVDVDGSTIDFDSSGQLTIPWTIGNGLKLESNILYADVDDSTIKWNDSGQLYAVTGGSGGSTGYDAINQYTWQSITDWAVGDIVLLADESSLDSADCVVMAFVKSISGTTLTIQMFGGTVGYTVNVPNNTYEIKFPYGPTTMASNVVSVPGMVITYGNGTMGMYTATWSMYPVGRVKRVSS